MWLEKHMFLLLMKTMLRDVLYYSKTISLTSQSLVLQRIITCKIFYAIGWMKVLLVLFGTKAFIAKLASTIPTKSSTMKDRIVLFVKSLVTFTNVINKAYLLLLYHFQCKQSLFKLTISLKVNLTHTTTSMLLSTS